MSATRLFALAVCVFGAALAASPASAAAVRTFVSGKGSDTNPCTITAPCRSLEQAVSQTAASGEVVVLDPAGYGTVTITQSISIVNDGVGTASISVPQNGNGININASGATVHIRGFEIDGNSVGGNSGINISSALSVEVENCVIRHLQYGLATNATGVAIEIQHSTIGDNSQYALFLSGTGTVNVDYLEMPQNASGMLVNTQDLASSLNIRRSFISGVGGANNGYGVLIYAGRVYLSDSEITNNKYGIYNSGGRAVVDRSTITANTYGLYNNSGASTYTYKTNAINDNSTADQSGTISSYTPE